MPLSPAIFVGGGLRGSLGAHIPRPYKDPWELTLTEAVVSDIRRPPT